MALGDMTREELIKLIDNRVQVVVYKRNDTRTTAEILDFFAKNPIIVSPDDKSSLELLREDRDQ
ncbi:MAG: hypothetical protein ACPG7F_15865 [Aggregatilineales bacterium]